jgi:hypothetical protein
VRRTPVLLSLRERDVEPEFLHAEREEYIVSDILNLIAKMRCTLSNCGVLVNHPPFRAHRWVAVNGMACRMKQQEGKQEARGTGLTICGVGG